MTQELDPIAKVLANLPPASDRPLTKCAVLPKRGAEEAHRVRPGISRNWIHPDPRFEVAPELRPVLLNLVAGKLPWPLLLYGGVGTGKTRAAICLCDVVSFARFWTVKEVKDEMWDKAPPWSRWGANDTPNLAVLDELGTRDDDQQFEYDAVQGFLDWREDRPTVYISNHPPQMLLQLYDERIESRLQSGTVFELAGLDRRKSLAVPPADSGEKGREAE